MSVIMNNSEDPLLNFMQFPGKCTQFLHYVFYYAAHEANERLPLN